MKPIHRGVVGLTEPGAATSAMVALTASQRAVAHYVSSGTIGIGTGRFGIRGTHLEPLADLTCPHILQESLPVYVVLFFSRFLRNSSPNLTYLSPMRIRLLRSLTSFLSTLRTFSSLSTPNSSTRLSYVHR